MFLNLILIYFSCGLIVALLVSLFFSKELVVIVDKHSGTDARNITLFLVYGLIVLVWPVLVINTLMKPRG